MNSDGFARKFRLITNFSLEFLLKVDKKYVHLRLF